MNSAYISLHRSAKMFFLSIMASVLPLSAQTTYNQAGTFTYTVPAGVTKIKVECWGGGGGGSKVTSNPRAGGGGGGGAYAASIVDVMPGNSYNLTVGAGGASSSNGASTNFNGGQVIAVGGAGGVLDSGNGSPGGQASACVGTIRYTGGNGGEAYNSTYYRYSGGGGGGAGSQMNGAAASGQTHGAGGDLNNGNTSGGDGADGRTSRGGGASGNGYGGGGSGGVANTSSDQNGGAGGAGGAVITPCRVEVTATSGVTNDGYTTLKEAIDAVNNGLHRGTVSILIHSSTTETSAISLNASGSGSTSYTSLVIYPANSGVSVSGAISGALFTFNGADGVVLDGRVNQTGTESSLVVTNTSVSTSAVTLEFNNTAQNNTVRYCLLQGGGGSTYNGTVTFGSSGNNSGNTLTECEITNNGGRRANAVYCNTSTTTSGNTLSNNRMHDTWLTSASSNSINLSGNGVTGWSITGNSFYDSGLATLTAAATYTAVSISTTNGSGFTISGNYVGGTGPNASGTAMSVGTSGTLYSAVLNPFSVSTATATASILQNNVVRNLALRSSSTSPFCGVLVSSGLVHVRTNQIGSSEAPIALTSSVSATSFGMNMSNSSNNITNEVTDNQIDGILASATTSTLSHSFVGIYQYNSTTNSLVVTGNTIGNTATPGSITTSSASSSSVQNLCGIYIISYGAQSLSGNTIANLRNASTSTSSAPQTCGIYVQNGAVTASKNFILNLSSASTSGSVYGVYIYGASNPMTFVNNIVSLGTADTEGSLYGIIDQGTSTYNSKLYHNTIYIGDTASTGNSYALYNSSTNNNRDYQNNVLFNMRSTGGSHYAVYYQNTASGSLISDYNVYAVSGTSNYLAYSGGNIDLIGLRALSKDLHSSDVNPGMVAMGGNSPTDFKIKNQWIGNTTISDVTDDFGGTNRTAFTSGAWEFFSIDVIQGGVFKASYATLKQAFDKINDGTWTGNITILINGGTVEPASAVLNPNVSPASYSSVVIYPQVSNAVLTGAFNAPVVHLNGTTNVTLNGSVIQGNITADLTIRNTNSGANASALQLSESAQNNTVTYCNLEAAPASATKGIVSIVAATSGLGTRQNTVTKCRISGLGSGASNRPYNAVYSAGTSSRPSSNNTISYNQICDFLHPSAASNGIKIDVYSPGIAVVGNSLYETTTFVPTASVEYAGIRIDDSNSSGQVVTGNYVGGSAAEASGTWVKSGQNSLFHGIYLNVGTASAASVQGNTIRNINHSNSGNANWHGVYIQGGMVDFGNVSGNSIGSPTGTGSIVVTNTTTATLTSGVITGGVFGIFVNSNQAVRIRNNSIGSVAAGNSNSNNATFLYGIYKNDGSGVITIAGNTVGGPNTPNSLHATSAANSYVQHVTGIYSGSSDSSTIENNEVANITNGTTSGQTSLTRGIKTNGGTVGGSNTIIGNRVHDLTSFSTNSNNYLNCQLIGIEQLSETSGTTQLLRENVIYNLKNTVLSKIEMYGIFYRGPTTGTQRIDRNFIHSFIIISTDQAYLHGLSVYAGTCKVTNNLLFLGNNIPTGCSIWGLWTYSTSPMEFVHNTSYIAGTASTGESNSYALRDLATGTLSRVIRNNILWNDRTNSNTEHIYHFSLYLAGSTGSYDVNYNDYKYFEMFAKVGSTNYSTFTPNWISGFDPNSIEKDPLLTNLGGVLASDYQPGKTLGCPRIAGAELDYGYQNRAETCTMGAWEYTPNPVEIWKNNTFQQSYPNLKGAFDAINNGDFKGALTVKITSNTRETATARLNASLDGNADYSSVVIYPTRTDIQVNGNLNDPLIDLYGADNVVFDGRPNRIGSSASLLLINTSTGSGAKTVLLQQSAQNDTVSYCYIKGSGTSASSGIVQLDGATTGSGNDNNTIIFNKITTATSGNRVLQAIYSNGSIGYVNDGNRILNNDIYDVLNPSESSYVIHVASNSSAFTISGNSIYETTAFAPTGGNTYQAIRLNNTVGTDFVVSGNSIGGSAPLCQGATLTMVNASRDVVFVPLYVNVGSAGVTSLQGNMIKSMSFSSSAPMLFAGIQIVSGSVDVGTTTGNQIGSTSGTGSLTLISSNSSATSYGIYVQSSSAVRVSNNTIGSVTTSQNSSNSNAHSFYAIHKTNSSGVFTANNNTVGSPSTAGSISALAQNNNSSNDQKVFGIYSLGTDSVSIQNNTVANLYNGAIYSKVGKDVCGISFTGGTSSNSIIQRNFIYALDHASTTPSAQNRMGGLAVLGGNVTVANNLIWIGKDETGNMVLYGIYDNTGSGVRKYLHNTVYISGTPSNTTLGSYAFNQATTNSGGTLEIRGNIFYNARLQGNSGTHYALRLNALTNVTVDGNVYRCVKTTPFYNQVNTTNYSSETTWESAVTMDDNSFFDKTPFVAPATYDATLFRPALDLPGVGSGIGLDYGMNPRNASTPTIGIWERVNKWKGNISIDFATPGNWTFNMVPATYDNVFFDDAPLRPCYLDQNRYVTDIINAQSAYRLLLNGYTLYLKGLFRFSNGAQIDASATGSKLVFVGSSGQTIPSGSLYTNKVYDLTVDNPASVVLQDSLILLNTLTATQGRLNATGSSSKMVYAGTVSQSIENNQFLNNQLYRLDVRNNAGVTLNADLKVTNRMEIATGANVQLLETRTLEVSGVLANQAGTSGLLLKSSALGTASLIHQTSGVSATVKRYIGGDALAWHFLSSPVAAQTIHGTAWTPSGTYGDGTGYDMYIWDEPSSCWVYNLNDTAGSVTWANKHPQTYFVPGKGYLYALQQSLATKQFAGVLNTGNISLPITMSTSAVDTLEGFNFIGNPYPSSINWKHPAGYTRDMLALNGGGYNIWTWSALNNNYGVFNSAEPDSVGTNNVGQYISPMQGFFVQASNSGTFVFNNTARSHYEAGNWLRSTQSAPSIRPMRVSVLAPSGGDEVKVTFGNSANEAGARKLFSPVPTSPSLYMNSGGSSYTTRYLTSPEETQYLPIQFVPGENGPHTLKAVLPVAGVMGSIYLEDRQTGTILDWSDAQPYDFEASTSDSPHRFVVHFGSVRPVDQEIHPKVWISDGNLTVLLHQMLGDYQVSVFDLQGRQISSEKMSGGEQCSVSLFGRGLYLVRIEGEGKTQTVKIIK